MNFDQSLFTAIYSLANHSGILDAAAIFIGRILPWLLIIVVLTKLLSVKNWRVRFYNISHVFLSLILGVGLIGEAIQFFYYRPRPSLVLSIKSLIPVPGSPAFPSTHAIVFFALATILLFTSRTWGIWFFGFATAIGFARIFTGVHWPLDVLGGALIGVASAYIVRKLLPPLSGYIVHDQ